MYHVMYTNGNKFRHLFRLAAHTTKGSTGCPIGVQVIGRHFQEELVLHAMEIIEDLVHYDKSANLQ